MCHVTTSDDVDQTPTGKAEELPKVPGIMLPLSALHGMLSRGSVDDDIADGKLDLNEVSEHVWLLICGENVHVAGELFAPIGHLEHLAALLERQEGPHSLLRVLHESLL